jgi:outer membrane protein assembly factor BamA
MFQLAESSDKWILTEPENSFAAAILKEDFYDFYWKRGFSGEIGISYERDLSLGVSYTAAKIENLERTASKALFGGKKNFRENWSTVLYDTAALVGVDGKLREVEFKATYDTRDYEEDPESGILTNLVYRQALDSDSSDFDYEAFDAELKYYCPVAIDQTLFFRLRGGYSDDELPLFRRYFIGGIGSLRGYEYKEFQGNRYVLFNADYIWRFFDSSFGAGVFFDAGKAAFSGTEFEDEDLKTDIGIAFLLGDDFRINLAQRLDDMDKSPVLSVRGKILF